MTLDPPLSFGDWLQQRRTALGLTREQLAARVGYSVSALRKLETGERRPSAQAAELLAHALELPAGTHTAFVRVARGLLDLERLPASGAKPAQSTPAAPPAQPPRDRLPVNATPLIGREPELAQLAQRLADPACRMLTLTGPGGVGKTRLAIRAAREAAGRFDDGATYVPLAPLTSSSFIIPATAEAVGFSFSGSADPPVQLARFLRDKQLLLVLDNAEHLLSGGAAEALAGLIACAPRLKLLVTSREVLALQAEWVFEVSGLPVHRAASGAGDAVELFVQRAQRAQAGFTPTDDDYAAIERICRRVDGLPLAVELAAAWVRVLTCDEIATEIERDPGGLASPARDVPLRHRSLGAVFEHSWALLSEDERSALAQLSAFRGGFSREAAAEVAGAPLALLLALVNKSLVQRLGGRRYGLHELVRQWCVARLEADAQAAADARERHGRYYLHHLLAAQAALTSDRQAATLAELGLDIDNCRAAWGWAVEARQLSALTQAAFVLLYFYELRGLYEEGEAVFRLAAEQLRGEASGTGPGAVAHWAMVTNQAYFTRRCGRHTLSHARLRESVAQLRRCGDRPMLRFALRYCGLACMSAGCFAEAQACLEESLALSEAAAQGWEVAITCLYLGIVVYERDALAAAQGYLDRGLAVGRGLGDPRLIALSLIYLGRTATERGDLVEASRALTEGLSAARQAGDRYDLGLALMGLGQVAWMSAQADEARARFETSRALFAEVGDLNDMALAEVHLGRLALGCGDTDAARRHFRMVVELGTAGQAPLFWPVALIGLARVNLLADPRRPEVRQQAFELALRLDQPERSRQCRLQAQALRAEVEAQLTPEQAESLRRQVPTQSLEALVTTILQAA